MDRKAWCPAVHRVIKNWTWLSDWTELWFPRRLLRISWTARKSNQSILKGINPEYSSEGLKLKLQYFGHLMRRSNSLEKTLMLGKTELGGEWNERGLDGWLASQTQWTWVRASSRNWWWTGKPGVLQSMGLQRVGHDWVIELHLINNAIMNTLYSKFSL